MALVGTVSGLQDIDDTDELRGRFFMIFLEQYTKLPETILWDAVREGLAQFRTTAIQAHELSEDQPSPADQTMLSKMVSSIKRVLKKKKGFKSVEPEFQRAANIFLEQYI